MDLKYQRTGTHRSLAADVDLAFRAAQQEGLKGLPSLIQCTLLSATLGSLARAVPPEVLEILARLGQVPQALDHARLMVNPERKAGALQRIAGMLAEEGQSDEALAVAREIENPRWKAPALGDVAQALAQSGRTREALAVAQEALAVAREIENPWQKARALGVVAQALVEAGNTQQVLVMAQEAFGEARQAGRVAAFACLGAFAPVLAALGPQVLVETWQRVREVEEWW
ncbi:MAG: hypothetical protein ACE5LU_08115 [Anaerolineae bacterium]